MKQHDPFEERLVELARMARLRAAVREDERPGHVGRPAIELAIDEVGEPPEEEPEGAPMAR